MTDVVQDVLAVEKQKACEMMSTSRYGKGASLHSSLSSGSFFLPLHGF
jgi:hypothetical protein